MLVHAPVACWTITPFSDAVAAYSGEAFFWQASAFIAALGAAGGGLAATAGAFDLERAQSRASKLATAHAVLMAIAWMLAAAGLIGRLDASYHAVVPPPLWAIVAGAGAFMVMVVGAGFGGELVYGRGVGVREDKHM